MYETRGSFSFRPCDKQYSLYRRCNTSKCNISIPYEYSRWVVFFNEEETGTEIRENRGRGRDNGKQARWVKNSFDSVRGAILLAVLYRRSAASFHCTSSPLQRLLSRKTNTPYGYITVLSPPAAARSHTIINHTCVLCIVIHFVWL